MSLSAVFKRQPFLKGIVEMMRYFEGHGELGDRREADSMLGAPSTMLEAWVHQRQGA